MVGGLSAKADSYIDTIIEYFPIGGLSVCRDLIMAHFFVQLHEVDNCNEFNGIC